MIQRREFITLIGGAAATWPMAARAQQPAMPVIGLLYGISASEWTNNMAAIRRGLSEKGFTQGHNFTFEYRWGDGHYDRLPDMAADLVQRRVDVVIAGGSSVATKSMMAATKTIPIVFTTASDPVAVGYVASLSRPGGNVTGATLLGSELGPKRLEIIRELIPTATKIALLGNPNNPATWQTTTKDVQEVARGLGLDVMILRGGTELEIAQSFGMATQWGASTLLVTSDTFFANQHRQIVDLAASYRLPAIYPGRHFVDAGGLISYGADRRDIYRQAGVYAGRILKGEKPSDLPVVQPTKFEFVINLKTAKALDITFPPSFLLRADEVIE